MVIVNSTSNKYFNKLFPYTTYQWTNDSNSNGFITMQIETLVNGQQDFLSELIFQVINQQSNSSYFVFDIWPAVNVIHLHWIISVKTCPLKHNCNYTMGFGCNKTTLHVCGSLVHVLIDSNEKL